MLLRCYPADVLDLRNWKIQLPVGSPYSQEVKQPQLATFKLKPYFVANWTRTAVSFRAHCGGATTKGSKYPRCELREMDGTKGAAWSSETGLHTMTIRQAITHLPDVKPHVVAGQIHDGTDDVIQIRLERRVLFVAGNGRQLGVLDPDYSLGTEFTTQITVTQGQLAVVHNGVEKVAQSVNSSTLYFKAGCYTQSNVEKGDLPDAYGQVVIRDLRISHIV